jgi:hypothetical protein
VSKEYLEGYRKGVRWAVYQLEEALEKAPPLGSDEIDLVVRVVRDAFCKHEAELGRQLQHKEKKEPGIDE